MTNSVIYIIHIIQISRYNLKIITFIPKNDICLKFLITKSVDTFCRDKLCINQYLCYRNIIINTLFFLH